MSINSIRKKAIIFRHPDGFALPTILIASMIMLTVLLASVTSTAAVRVSLVAQYYNNLSQTAGDAGVAYAKSCLADNNGAPLWSDAKPLRPNTDCSGNQLVGFTCPDASTDDRCSVVVNDNIVSTFSVGLPSLVGGKASEVNSVGLTKLLKTSSGSVWRQYSSSNRLYIPVVISKIIFETGCTITTSGGLRTHTCSAPGTYNLTASGGGAVTVTIKGAGGGGGGMEETSYSHDGSPGQGATSFKNNTLNATWASLPGGGGKANVDYGCHSYNVSNGDPGGTQILGYANMTNWIAVVGGGSSGGWGAYSSCGAYAGNGGNGGKLTGNINISSEDFTIIVSAGGAGGTGDYDDGSPGGNGVVTISYPIE